jgi:hypothetical protein
MHPPRLDGRRDPAGGGEALRASQDGPGHADGYDRADRPPDADPVAEIDQERELPAESSSSSADDSPCRQVEFRERDEREDEEELKRESRQDKHRGLPRRARATTHGSPVTPAGRPW